MLEVTVVIKPFGSEARARTLWRVRIVNVTGLGGASATYRVDAEEPSSRAEVETFFIRRFSRERGAAALVSLATRRLARLRPGPGT